MQKTKIWKSGTTNGTAARVTIKSVETLTRHYTIAALRTKQSWKE